MSETEGDVVFENKESKPILVKRLEMPISNWVTLKANEVDNSDKGSMSPFREKISEMVGGGELSEAILDTSGEYVFRCFARRSDNEPTNNVHYNSTLSKAYDNLHEFGVDFSMEERKSFHTSPGHMWYTQMWPNLEDGIDRSFIAVYKNKGGVLTQETGIRVESPKRQTRLGSLISKVSGKNNSSKPSMRDLLVGVVEIDWKKD